MITKLSQQQSFVQQAAKQASTHESWYRKPSSIATIVAVVSSAIAGVAVLYALSKWNYVAPTRLGMCQKSLSKSKEVLLELIDKPQINEDQVKRLGSNYLQEAFKTRYEGVCSFDDDLMCEPLNHPFSVSPLQLEQHKLLNLEAEVSERINPLEKELNQLSQEYRSTPGNKTAIGQQIALKLTEIRDLRLIQLQIRYADPLTPKNEQNAIRQAMENLSKKSKLSLSMMLNRIDIALSPSVNDNEVVMPTSRALTDQNPFRNFAMIPCDFQASNLLKANAKQPIKPYYEILLSPCEPEVLEEVQGWTKEDIAKFDVGSFIISLKDLIGVSANDNILEAVIKVWFEAKPNLSTEQERQLRLAFSGESDCSSCAHTPGTLSAEDLAKLKDKNNKHFKVFTLISNYIEKKNV